MACSVVIRNNRDNDEKVAELVNNSLAFSPEVYRYVNEKFRLYSAFGVRLTLDLVPKYFDGVLPF